MADNPVGDGQNEALEQAQAPEKLPEEQVLDLLIGDLKESEEEAETPDPETGETEEQEQPAKVDDSVETHPESETEGETPEVSNLGELAEAIEVDTQFLYGLEVPMGDGLQPMTIGQLKDAATEVERTRTELAKEKTAVEAARSRVSYDEELNKLKARLELFDEQFEEQADLRRKIEKDNPGQVARAVQYYETARRQMESQIEDRQLAMQQEMEDKMAEFRRHETELLMKKLPEWKDESVAKRDIAAVQETAAKFGFSAQEVAGIEDHRALLVLLELAKAQGKLESVKTVPKRVAKLPKRVKSVAKSENAASAKQRSAIEKAKKTNRLEDKVDAVTSLLLGGS